MLLSGTTANPTDLVLRLRRARVVVTLLHRLLQQVLLEWNHRNPTDLVL
jgi:hypothetical protein